VWMLSRFPSWKRMENSFSPMSFASPSVAATLPAVSEASDVASTSRMSPWEAICWPFLSTRNTILALESTCRRWRVSLICRYSSSYITRSGEAICAHHTSSTLPLNLPSAFESLRHRNLIGVFEIAADRKSEREPRRAHAKRTKLLGQIERGRFAFDVRIGRDDDLANAPALNAPQQAADVDILRPDSLERRERTEEHVKHASEVARLLDRRDVEGLLDHTDDRRIATRIAADRARIDVRHVVAGRAAKDF